MPATATILCEFECGRAAEIETSDYFEESLRICETCLPRVARQGCNEVPTGRAVCDCEPHGRPTLPRCTPLLNGSRRGD